MNPRVASALQFFESMVKAMALRPEDLHVITRTTIGAVDVLIRCNAADTARLIGKRGAMADCLRVIGHAVFGHMKTQFRLDDVTDDGSEKEPFTEFRNDTNWDPTTTIELLKTMLTQLGWKFDAIKATKHNDWTFKIWVTVPTETARRMRDEIVGAINAIFIVIGTRSGKKVFVRFQERGQSGAVGWRDFGIHGPQRQPTSHAASSGPDELRRQRGVRV